jgi:putative ABC transport system substrate-binding protein
MDRRTFLICGFAALAAQLAAAAMAGEVRRIGILADTPGPHWEVFRKTLAQLGHAEGKALALEWRWSEGQPKRFPDLAAELVRLKVDVIVSEGTPATRAAKDATSSIPIVMAIVGNPVAMGFVQSLARPGGNVTGSSSRSPELYPKQMELLKAVVPGLSRLAVLWNSDASSGRLHLKEIESAAKPLGIHLQMVEARGARELKSAFSMLSGKRLDALVVVPDPSFDSLQAQIAELAANARLPAIFNKSAFAQAGGLLAYGARYSDFFRRAAYYVDKILKGAKPADLPVEQASVFELVINLKTAKALGITIPPTILVRADQVIQ